MKAIGYQHSLPITDPRSLEDIERPKPTASGHDVLVRIEAISVNPVDTKIRHRVQPDNGEHNVLGWDAAGVVDAIGEKVTHFNVGDNIWYAGAIDRSGTNAQYHLVDERIAAKMPTTLNFTHAAALPLTSITAWELLFDRFGLTAASTGTLLIIGASGGVGSIMVQLAKKLTQLTVIGTASRTETQQWVRELGADHVINHHQSITTQLAEIGHSSIDYIASLTNTDSHLEAITEAIAPQGKFGLIDDPEALDIMPFKRKSVSIHWELMFTRSLFATADMIEQHRLLTTVAKMIDDGNLQSTLCANFGKINAENIRKAHALLESGASKGKIVLTGF